MLQLIANNATLNIENASFNLTQKSPIGGSNPGSYVFSVTIPYTPQNAAAFGWPSRLTRMETLSASASARIIYNGINVQKGEWQAKTSTTKTIQLEMLIGGGNFNNVVDGKILSDYITATFTYADIVTHLESQVTKTYPEVTHQFPCILNPLFYPDEVNTQFEGVINNYENGFRQLASNNNNIVPQLYLLYIVKELFAAAGYAASGDIFQDTQLQKALIYSNYSLENLVSTGLIAEISDTPVVTPFVIFWDTNIQDDGSHYTSGTGCYRVSSIGNYSIHIEIEHKLETSITPPDISYFIEIYYGSTIIDSYSQPTDPDDTTIYFDVRNVNYPIAAADVDDDIYVKIYFIDASDVKHESRIISGSISIVNTDAPVKNEYANEIDYSNHVPEMKVKDFLNHFFVAEQVIPFYNHDLKTVELVLLKNNLNAPEQSDINNGLIRDTLKVYENDYKGLTFTFDFQGPDELLNNNFSEFPASMLDASVDTYDDLPNVITGAIVFVKTLNAYYKRTYDKDTFEYGWEAVGDNYYPYILDDGEDPISTQLAPMLMRQHSIIEEGDTELPVRRNMPAIYAPGTSNAYGIKNEFPLRIMFYYGLEYASTANEYPFASTQKWRTDGTVFLPVSWQWSDIITRYWEEVIKWRKRRLPIEFENIVSPTFIANLNFREKFAFQNTLIMLKEVYTKIENKSFGPGKFKGWTK